jgi:hypothetical protein
MKKSFIAAGMLAAVLGLGGTASALTAPNVISIEGSPDLITFIPETDAYTVDEGETVDATVTVRRATGRNNFTLLVWLTGCGDGATATPGEFVINYADKDIDDQDISFTVDGLTPGTCQVGFATSVNGKPYLEEDVITITVNDIPDTTVPDTTTPDTTVPPTTVEPTTSLASGPGVPAAGSQSAAMAMMALGLVLLGGVTIAATRRRAAA